MAATIRNSETVTPKIWPFEEAAKVARRLAASGKGHALFETGYGPSGLPHIGTFGEVARTSWVRHAFTDFDRLAIAADRVQRRHGRAAKGAGERAQPRTADTAPRQTADPHSRPVRHRTTSFGAHNNARLRAFLDSFGFDYEFASSTDYYAAGRFDAALIRVLECYDEVMAVILPTLGPGPSRHLFADPADPSAHRACHAGADGKHAILSRAPSSGVTRTAARRSRPRSRGGAAKLQWKADWAMRWYALDVDYEMSGKDLIEFRAAVGAHLPHSGQPRRRKT